MNHFKKPSVFFLLAIVVLFYAYFMFLAYFYQGIFPGVKVASLNVQGLSPSTAQTVLTQEFGQRLDKPYQLDLKAGEPKLNIYQQVDKAYQWGRSGNYWQNIYQQANSLLRGLNLPLTLSYQNQAAVDEQINQLGLKVYQEPVDAQVILGETVSVTPSKEGQKLNSQVLKQQLEDYLSLKSTTPPSLPLKTIPPKFTTAEAVFYQQALNRVKTSPITLRFNNQSWNIDQSTLYNLLALPPQKPSLLSWKIGDENLEIYSLTLGPTTLSQNPSYIDGEKLQTFLKQLADQINQPAYDARFIVESVEPGKSPKVKEFQAAREGKELDINQTAQLITQQLQNPTSPEITLPVKVTKPKVATEDVNNLGIQELVGQGVSNFTGSIENRIFNLKLAASRIHGVLIPPGETFSFNKTVGDISASTGYKQAYVIKSGRTVLDDGGGVCQVSTTLFRAVLNSGLPVVERAAHAYRVSYYEQGFPPGLDATVFSPSVDFKFKNDTPNYLLLQAYSQGSSLYVDFYGTKDGRTVSLSTSKILSRTPPLPELRQDDPSLPKGTIKQVDWAAEGANVAFDRSVTKNGQTLLSETWKSNYRPWQAVYLVGTRE